MASEEAERAVITKAVAVRARDLVRALLAPGGLVSVEDAGETVAVSVRSCVAKTSPENLAVRRQDVEKLAVAAATASLTVIVNAGSLTAPHSMVEEVITKAVVASRAQVEDTRTSSDYIFVLWYLVVTFCCGVALLVVRLSN
ncbi:uncharacterized protein LOC120662868 isoform X2 [Panicum virgatum]|uniref:Uncharacterized protein n=1 Tax=Panicum virgatum TaxID=38727 RepID=A0A8T0WAD0_PANVG|nr:uncharacterized protein LOC120662868 isoform X2 [Panicum virgatum]KAG2640169.1 hypothetical protein PVAP13_2KG073016 [Panicum virgatum]